MKSLLTELLKYHHVIWDWNGTLLADVEHNVRTMNVLLADTSLPEITIDQHREKFRFPVIEYYTELGFDTSPKSFLDLCEVFNANYDRGLQGCELVPGMKEVVLTLSKAGIEQSILSASKQDALERALDHFDMRDAFQYIFGVSDNTAHSKLERGRELISTAGIDSQRTVLVGDTTHDWEVGVALNVDVILVKHGHQSEQRLRSVHSKVV